MKIEKTMLPIGLFQFISFLRRAIFYAFFYLYLRTFLELPTTLAALLGTANFLASTFGQLKIWGPRLNNKPSLARKYVVYGNLIAAFTYFITFIGHVLFLGLESNIGAALSKIGAAFFMIVLLSILEIFWSMSDLGVRFLIAQASIGQQRGQLIGLFDGIGLIGQIIGFSLSGLLYRDGLGFSEGIIFYVVVILIFLCALVIQLSPQVKEELIDEVSLSSSVKLKELLKEPSFAVFLLCLTILIIGISSSAQIFIYYSDDPTGLNFNDLQLSYLLILFSLIGGLVTPIAGRASDKMGRIPIMAIGSLGASISYLCFFLMGEQPFLIIAIIYSSLGVCFAIIQSVAFAHTADILPDEMRGTGFALFNIALATGWGLAGFVIGGPVVDLLIIIGQSTSDAYRFAFLVSSIVILSGFLSLMYYSKLIKRNIPLLSGDNKQF